MGSHPPPRRSPPSPVPQVTATVAPKRRHIWIHPSWVARCARCSNWPNCTKTRPAMLGLLVRLDGCHPSAMLPSARLSITCSPDVRRIGSPDVRRIGKTKSSNVGSPIINSGDRPGSPACGLSWRSWGAHVHNTLRRTTTSSGSIRLRTWAPLWMLTYRDGMTSPRTKLANLPARKRSSCGRRRRLRPSWLGCAAPP